MKSQSLAGIVKHGFTHALRIPLATPTSRPQLERALRRIMSHPTASHVHPAAFARPDTLYLEIGTIRLQTPESLEKAVQLLKSLDLNGMMFDCMQSQRPAGGDSSDLPMSSPVSCKPLLVSMSGISHAKTLSYCRRLHVPVADHSGFLLPFLLAVRQKFLSASFLKLDTLQDPTYIPLHSKLIDHRFVRSRELNTKSVSSAKSGGRPVYRKSSFDVRGLHHNFKAFAFTSTFALERLCITGTHHMNIVKEGRVIGRGSEEVASVPLPGIDHLEEQPELTNVTYLETAITFV